MTPEGRVKAMVKRKLVAAYGARCWRFMPVQSGFGAPALDFLLCIDGLFVSIETKAPGNNLTPQQHATMREMVVAGGLVFVVHDEASMDVALSMIGLHLKFAQRCPQGPAPEEEDEE